MSFATSSKYPPELRERAVTVSAMWRHSVRDIWRVDRPAEGPGYRDVLALAKRPPDPDVCRGPIRFTVSTRRCSPAPAPRCRARRFAHELKAMDFVEAPSVGVAGEDMEAQPVRSQALGVFEEHPPDTLSLVFGVDVELLEPGVGGGGEAQDPVRIMGDPDASLHEQDMLHPPASGWFVMRTDKPRHRLATRAQEHAGQLDGVAGKGGAE